MRRFLPAIVGFGLASVLIAGSSASWGSAPAIAVPGTIDIATSEAPDPEADQAVLDAMEIWFTPGTGSVGPLGGVTVSGGFFCQDSDAPGSTVRLEITLVQNNDAHGYAEGLGVCQGNRTWTATVRPDLLTTRFVPNQTIEAHVTMVKDGDVGQLASADALLIETELSHKTNPSATSNGPETLTITGTYSCDASYAPGLHLTATATEEQPDGTAGTGVALLELTCPATNRPWTATITSTERTVHAGKSSPRITFKDPTVATTMIWYRASRDAEYRVSILGDAAVVDDLNHAGVR